MQIFFVLVENPFLFRRKLALNVFWVVLLLLINGWVDFASNFLTNKQYNPLGNQIVFDDIDSCYEWIAEEIFGIENAIPEGENGSDEQGSTHNIKITLAYNENIELDQIPAYFESEYGDLILSAIPFPFIAGWVQPPNV